ncbi:GntR family transcriptional regulator [Paracoccus benzoatiresistens]|uniref:GntR family transcriptional regulator n=1 Tax=Paracoccus benzoatiresistens TaxID=2997341 RepID=A0ABT4JAU9_9RHOB|nr:GntR family transcriptional regulator [Paracoccus sp. EF6]MCZ0963596.1 GntR family transcriptional regulator [Paracoccus sp. EF6]
MTKANSPTPLYHRVYAVMRERIVNGYYPDNVPVPSEAELSDSFGVSRITIRKAMEMLSAEGLITRMRGRGTFVTDRAQQSALNRAVVSNINGLFSYLNTVGQSTRLKVISLDRGEAPPRICAQMGIAPTTELIRSVRLRELDKRPYSLSMAYLLPEIGAGLTRQDLASTNMIDLVQREGAVVEQVEQVLTATLADEDAAELLQVPIGAPLMRVNRFFFDDKMVPFYAAEILYCADRYEYRVSLKREQGRDFHLDGSQPG